MSLIGKVAGIAGALALCTTAAVAAPLYQYTLTVADTGASSFAGTGTIGFSALAGSLGELDGFSFTLTSLDGAPPGQLPLSFGAGSVSSLSFAIDPATFALTLDLDTTTQIDGNRRWDLSLDTMSPFTTGVLCNAPVNGTSTALACYAQNRTQQDSGSSLLVTGGPTGSVPMPGMLALLGAGCLAFGATRRAKRA